MKGSNNNSNTLNLSQSLKALKQSTTINCDKSKHFNSEMQSPKMSNKMLRNKSQPCFCSFSERNLKTCNGTTLPKQYDAKGQDYWEQLYKPKKQYTIFDYLNNNSKNTPIVIDCNKKEEIAKNAENQPQSKTQKNFYKPDLHFNKNLNNVSKPDTPSNFIYNPKAKTENDFIDSTKANKLKFDFYKPDGYEKFTDERKCLKRAQSSKVFIYRFGTKDNVPFREFSKYLRKKNAESDIFFQKTREFNMEAYNAQRNKIANYGQSDIFNFQNDKLAELKSGEKSLFKQNYDHYNASKQSDSSWQERFTRANLVNHASTGYNILNPDIKNFVKTKDEIQKECNLLYPNFPTANRQKSLSSYKDTNTFATSASCKNYIEAIKNNPGRNPFARTNQLCSDLNNNYLGYKNMIDKPFPKTKVFN